MPEFTEQQLINFEKYEKVRASGVVNMFTPEAAAISGLSIGDHFFVLDNYEELKAAVESRNNK